MDADDAERAVKELLESGKPPHYVVGQLLGIIMGLQGEVRALTALLQKEQERTNEHRGL